MQARDSGFWTRLMIVTVAPTVLVAAILFRVYDLRSTKTALEIGRFREVAKAEAVKRSVAATPPGSIIWIQAISPADSQRLLAMQETHDAQYHRRWLAGRVAVVGTIWLAVLGGVWVFVRRTNPTPIETV